MHIISHISDKVSLHLFILSLRVLIEDLSFIARAVPDASEPNASLVINTVLADNPTVDKVFDKVFSNISVYPSNPSFTGITSRFISDSCQLGLESGIQIFEVSYEFGISVFT